jgi:hypothetical protein
MRSSKLLVSLALGCAAGAALAASPGPATRQGLLPLGVCEAGPLAGQACVDDFDCEGEVPTQCTTPIAQLAVRGVLTFIADKDSGPWDATGFVPETPDAQGIGIPADLTKSTLTVVLEFTRNGKDYVLAETFQDLTDYANPALGINCVGFCVPTWREPAVEDRIARPSDLVGAGGGGGGGGGGGSGGGGGQQAGAAGIRVQWATGSPALQAALVEALELPPGSVAFLERVNDTELFDHSDQEDVLASIHRTKVTIRAVLPGAP